MSHSENFKRQLLSKERFYSWLTGKNISDKNNEHAFQDLNKFRMKTMTNYHDLYLK